MERFFTNVKKLNDQLAARAGEAGQPSAAVLDTWFHNLLARGAGTSRTFRSTSGAYHAVAQSLEKLEKYPGAALQALDSELEGFAGRPDLLLKIDDWVSQFEFKRLTRLLQGREISQLHAIVRAVYKRTTKNPRFPTRALQEDALKETLKRLVYEFPADAKTLEVALKTQIRTEAARKLPDWAKAFAENLVVEFGGTLP